MNVDKAASLVSLADRIRSQAEVAARPGQYDDLYDIAEELDRQVVELDDIAIILLRSHNDVETAHRVLKLREILTSDNTDCPS